MDKRELQRLLNQVTDARATAKAAADSTEAFIGTDGFKTLPDKVKGVFYAICFEEDQIAGLFTAANLIITQMLLRGNGDNAPKNDTDAPAIDDNAKEV